MFHLFSVKRVFSLLIAITMIISLLPTQRVNAQASGVQAPYIGIWLSASELANLPTSGNAWNSLLNAANSSAGSPDIQNQDSDNDVYVLAKALVYARTGDSSYRAEVISNLKKAVDTEKGGRTLALGRNLVSYVIAADLVNLPANDASFDQTFRAWLRRTLTETLDRTLVSTHEDRPNNWGTHAGASRAAVAWYLNDRTELNRTAQVFAGWLGERASYTGFTFGDLSWQCNPGQPVGVNPKGCTKNGVNIDGVQPEEMRRGGTFQNPPTPTDYAWEAMQGALVQAVILHRAGYAALQWGDRGILRAVDYLYRIGWQAKGDDTWQPWLLNYYLGTKYPTSTAGKGKNMGWTDWTHAPRTGGSPAPLPTQKPTSVPTSVPTQKPTNAPTNVPTQKPTSVPTNVPTQQPTSVPTNVPTQQPTSVPTNVPTQQPPASAPPLPASVIKVISFEDGQLQHNNTGADRVSGDVGLNKASPLNGSFSAAINSSAGYLQEDFNGSDTLFVSFLLKINALPGKDARILLISNDGDTIGNIVLNKNGSLRLRSGSDTLGGDSSALTVGQTYQVGLYQKRGKNDGQLMAYLAPAGQAFGQPFASVTNGKWNSAASFVRFGATNGSAVDVLFDNILITTGFLP